MTVTEFNVKVVPRPSAADEVKAELLRMAEDFLAQVRAGDIVEVVMIVKHPNAQWSNRWSGSLDYPRTIGELEITKYEMVASYSHANRIDSK